MKQEEENFICQKCGKCCRSYWIFNWIFTDIPEEVERFESLRTDKIEVIKIKDKLWKIIYFRIPSCFALSTISSTFSSGGL